MIPSQFAAAVWLFFVCAIVPFARAFTEPSFIARSARSTTSSLSRRHPSTTSLNIFGPNQALAIERKKNPAKFEATIQNLMKQKKLSRDKAEKRYGEYLLDPDGFALRASDAQRKKDGYKNWEEAAIGRSSDPEATRERIAKFKRDSQIKALAIIGAFVGCLLYLSGTHQVVSLQGIAPNPTSNPYFEQRVKSGK